MTTETIWANLAESIRLEKDGTTIPVPVEDIRALLKERKGEPSDANLRAVAGALAAIEGKPWYFDTDSDPSYESSARVILRALRAALSLREGGVR